MTLFVGPETLTLPDDANPNRQWAYLDVEDEPSINKALAGCDAAFFLVHSMGQGRDYPEREARSAANFATAAKASGVRRIVYLGGVLPAGGRVSKHLGSRQKTGELLRAGPLSVIELRAAMIIGEGSASWTMVKDLAARLPAMLLPRWLRNCSYPVAIRRCHLGAGCRFVLSERRLASFRVAGAGEDLAS